MTSVPVLYPRLFVYADCNGMFPTGYPFTVADTYGAAVNTSWIAAHMPKYDLLITQPRWCSGRHDIDRFDILQALRAACPNLKILAHIFLQRLQVSGSNPQNSQLQLLTDVINGYDAWLYDLTSGLTTFHFNLAFKSGGQYVVAQQFADILATIYRNDYFPENAVEGGPRFDGFQLESSPSVPVGNADYVRAGYASEALLSVATAEAWRECVTRLRAGIGSGPIITGLANGGADFIFPPNAPEAALNKANSLLNCDGWLRENFPNQNGGDWLNNMVFRTADPLRLCYLPEQTLYRQPCLSTLTSVLSGTNPTTADSLRRMRWGLGSSALGNGMFTIGQAAQPDRLLPPLSYEWELPAGFEARSWGRAVGNYYVKGTVYKRRFEHGELWVNSSSVPAGIPGNDAVFVASPTGITPRQRQRQRSARRDVLSAWGP